MIGLFRLSVVAFLACAAVAGATLPDQVAVRFDEAGDPTMYRTRLFAVASMVLIGGALALVFEVLIRVVPARGGDRLGLPFREHWVQPQHQAAFRRMIAADVAFFGFATMVMLSMVVLAAARAAGEGQMGLGRLGVVAVLGFAMATLTWVVWMFTTRYQPRKRR